MIEKTQTRLSPDIEKGKTEPRDAFKIVYILFFVFGILHLLPSSFFITAHDYWMYKFRNTSFEETDSQHRTYLQKEFSPGLTIALQVSTVTCNFLILLFGHKIRVKLQLFGSLTSILFFFISSAIFIHIDTDSWQDGFFVLTILTVALINGMTAVFGMAVFSILSSFSSEFLAAYLNGSGVSGIFTASLQIMSLGTGLKTKENALVYFWLAIAMIVFCIYLTIAVSKRNRFYRHKYQKEEQVKNETQMSLRERWEVFKMLWPSITIFSFCLLTLDMVHTSITSLVVSEDEGKGDWNDTYFVPVITFLLCAVCELSGRIVAQTVKINVDGKWLAIFSAIRAAIFIPLFMLCNAQPRNHLPVLFPHDYQYIIIMVVFSFTGGYLLCMSNMLVPRSVPPEKLENAYHVFLVVNGILYAGLCYLSFVSVDLI